MCLQHCCSFCSSKNLICYFHSFHSTTCCCLLSSSPTCSGAWFLLYFRRGIHMFKFVYLLHIPNFCYMMIIPTLQVCICLSSCNTRLELSMHLCLGLWGFVSPGPTLCEIAPLSSVISFPWAVLLGREFIRVLQNTFFFPFFFCLLNAA